LEILLRAGLTKEVCCKGERFIIDLVDLSSNGYAGTRTRKAIGERSCSIVTYGFHVRLNSGSFSLALIGVLGRSGLLASASDLRTRSNIGLLRMKEAVKFLPLVLRLLIGVATDSPWM
jgi:hypothetical protein